MLKRDLALARIALGDVLVHTGDLEGAPRPSAALALLEPLVLATEAPSRRDVNTARGRIWYVLGEAGRAAWSPARPELEALAVSEELLKADPSNALAARDTYIDYDKVAFLQEALGDVETAIVNQRRCVVLCEAQVEANPAQLSAARRPVRWRTSGWGRCSRRSPTACPRLAGATRRPWRSPRRSKGGSLERGRTRRPVGGPHEARATCP